MPIPRPPRGIRWLLTQTATYDVLIAAFTSVIGFSSAWNYWSQGRWRLAIIVFLGTVGIVAFSVLKHLIGLAAARKKDSTHELEGCLYTLHEVLAPDPQCRLRLAIHVPVDETLEQVTEYVGDKPKPGRIGRRFPANAGITGKAFRERDVFVGRRINDDYEAYVREMVREWNYTEERARHLEPGVMEWMAVPFIESDRVYAILYLDATQRGFFTPDRQELVLAAQRGIAVFVGKRYT
jgi:GAF domain